MYILYPQFKYQLSLFYLNSCLLSHLHLPPSNSVFLCLPFEIQDCIYCGCSIKAEAKIHSNSIHCQSLPISLAITNNTSHLQHHQSNSDLCLDTTLIVWLVGNFPGIYIRFYPFPTLTTSFYHLLLHSSVIQ